MDETTPTGGPRPEQGERPDQRAALVAGVVAQQLARQHMAERERAAGERHDAAEGEAEPVIARPDKVVRIAAMVRELLDDTRQAAPDERGRLLLRQIYERAVAELREVLSEDLQRELEALAPPIEGVPTESEIRVAQAQLVGWLEGLFHGIQAAIWAQQMAARAQLEQMQRRMLSGGPGGPQPGEPPPPPEGEQPHGQYL